MRINRNSVPVMHAHIRKSCILHPPLMPMTAIDLRSDLTISHVLPAPIAASSPDELTVNFPQPDAVDADGVIGFYGSVEAVAQGLGTVSARHAE